MKPLLSITLLTWMCLFGATQGVHALGKNQKQAVVKDKFTWHTNIETASKLAKASNKKLFILFTGSDWCPPCKALKRNVLDKRRFQSLAKEDYVFVMADFPNAKRQSASLKEHNKKLAAKYGVQGFPKVVLADAGGKEIKSIDSYNGESVSKYLKYL